MILQSRLPKEMVMQKKKSHLVISVRLFTQYFWLFSFKGGCENPKADFSAQLPETDSAIRCLKKKFNSRYHPPVSLSAVTVGTFSF